MLEWLDQQSIETLYLTTITVGENRYGLATLANEKRKNALQARFEVEVLPLFHNRVLSYNLAATETYAAMMARAKDEGLAIGTADGIIVAIAKCRRMKVATRDPSPFLTGGIEVTNPWL